MDFKIRRARKSDLDSVLTFCLRIWQERDYSERTWPSWIGDPKRVMLVAEKEGSACGIIRGEMISAREGWVEGVRIDPDHKSRGIGSLLLGSIIPILERKGSESIRSLIAYDNLASQRVFEKNGFSSPLLDRPFKIKRRIKLIESGSPPKHLAQIGKGDMALAMGLIRGEKSSHKRRLYLEATGGLYCCDGVHWREWNEGALARHLEAGEVWVWRNPAPLAIAVVTTNPVRPGVWDVGLLEGRPFECRSLLGGLARRSAVSFEKEAYPPSVRTFFPLGPFGLQRVAREAEFRSDRFRHKAMYLYEWQAENTR